MKRVKQFKYRDKMSEVQQSDGGQEKGKHKRSGKESINPHRYDSDGGSCIPAADILFILTTTFSKPKTMDITMPVKDKIDDAERTKVPASQTVSILLTENDRIIWYVGMDDPSTPPVTNSADFSQSGPNSIRTMLLERNKLVLDKSENG